ncbi:hypothetical protein JCM19045_4363 [Bacillus sp. JCM 19045]|nr:hypothetical protein JCM19045_4363 [Bacillus sp. JCM 19045]
MVLLFGQLRSLMDCIAVFVIGSVAAIFYFHIYLLTESIWKRIKNRDLIEVAVF